VGIRSQGMFAPLDCKVFAQAPTDRLAQAPVHAAAGVAGGRVGIEPVPLCGLGLLGQLAFCSPHPLQHKVTWPLGPCAPL